MTNAGRSSKWWKRVSVVCVCVVRFSWHGCHQRNKLVRERSLELGFSIGPHLGVCGCVCAGCNSLKLFGLMMVSLTCTHTHTQLQNIGPELCAAFSSLRLLRHLNLLNLGGWKG